jgi:hypothetical protein
MATGGQAYPWRVACRFQNRAGFVAIDQLRTVDIERIARRLGKLNPNTLLSALNILQEMFYAWISFPDGDFGSLSSIHHIYGMAVYQDRDGANDNIFSLKTLRAIFSVYSSPMNLHYLKYLLELGSVSIVLAYSLVRFATAKDVVTFVQLSSAATLLVVLLNHIGHQEQLVPGFEWIGENSVAHCIRLRIFIVDPLLWLTAYCFDGFARLDRSI